MRRLVVILLCFFSFEAGASRLDEIPERIELLGRGLADAYLAACLEKLPAGELLEGVRETAAARDRLRARCGAAYEAWRGAASRLDETGDFEEVERHQRELLPCWNPIEAMQEEVRALARRCLEAMRRPVFPLGFSELDTQTELVESIRCQSRSFCTLRPEVIPTRPPSGWLSGTPHQVALGFSPLGIDRILTSVFALRNEPSCEAARDRLQAWSDRLEAIFPGIRWDGALPGRCEPGSRVAALGDHLVTLLLIEGEGRFSAAALVNHQPWRVQAEGADLGQ